MDYSPSEIARRLIIAQGLGTLPVSTNQPAWGVFVGREPTSPDNTITCLDTVGHSDGREMGTGILIAHPGVQVRVRSADHPTGYAKALAIRTALSESVYRTTITIAPVSYLVQAVTNLSTVIAIGREQTTARSIFVVNMTLSFTKL